MGRDGGCAERRGNNSATLAEKEVERATGVLVVGQCGHVEWRYTWVGITCFLGGEGETGSGVCGGWGGGGVVRTCLLRDCGDEYTCIAR